MKIDLNPYFLKLAETDTELVAAQRLRYRVFVEEMGAKTDPRSDEKELERDRFDPFFDHLILCDSRITHPEQQVVGVYRLLPSERANQGVGYYGAGEFDLSKIQQSGRSAVELGRSCIDPAHRGGLALHMLWLGVAHYVQVRDIKIIFGTASLPGGDVKAYEQALSYLWHCHLAAPELRVAALPENALPMNILPESQLDKTLALRQLPPLIKAYLRLGGRVGDGASLDREFNTIDVCMIVDTDRMSPKHRAFYMRGTTV